MIEVLSLDLSKLPNAMFDSYNYVLYLFIAKLLLCMPP